jgi:hypothetical protein
MFIHWGWYDHGRSKKSTAPHYSLDDPRFVAIFCHQGLDPRLNFTISGIEARVSKVLALAAEHTNNALTTPKMGASRNIYSDTPGVEASI